jgi:hypothetical protein
LYTQYFFAYSILDLTRSEILKRQDAMEQKKKLFCVILTGPIIQKHNDFSEVSLLLCTSKNETEKGFFAKNEKNSGR